MAAKEHGNKKEKMLAMLSIGILGSLLIMMGKHDRSEALFYYFRLGDRFLRTICYG